MNFYKTEYKTPLAMLNLTEVGLFFLKEPLTLLLEFTFQRGACQSCTELIFNSDILWLQQQQQWPKEAPVLCSLSKMLDSVWIG